LPLEQFTVSLTGNLKGKELPTAQVANVDNDQIAILEDGGDLSSVEISHFGNGKNQGDGGDDKFILDLADFNDDFTLTVKSFNSFDVFTILGHDTFTATDNGSAEGDDTYYTINYTGSDGQPHTLTFFPISGNGSGRITVQMYPCFGPGTLIKTPDGDVPVEHLAVGDLVYCASGKLQPILWISHHAVQPDLLDIRPDLRPIRFMRGSLGPSQPFRDLLLSPLHMVLIDDWRAEVLYGAASVLVRARDLVNDQTILSDYSDTPITYTHFLLPIHDSVIANGIKAESLLPGKVAMTTLNSATRTSLQACLDEYEIDPDLQKTCAPVSQKHMGALLDYMAPHTHK
jgi:hypothetical protein